MVPSPFLLVAYACIDLILRFGPRKAGRKSSWIRGRERKTRLFLLSLSLRFPNTCFICRMGKEGATGLERAAQHISRRLSPPFSPPHVLLLVSLKHRTKVSQEKMPSLSDGSPEAFAAEHVFGGPNLSFPLSLSS